MTQKIRIGWWLVLGSICVVFFPPLSYAGLPIDQVRNTVESVVAVLRDPGLKSAARKKERQERLWQLISGRFDFAEMAKRSLGSHWRQLSPPEQEEFASLFADLLKYSYISRIEAYNNEKFVFLRESVDTEYAEIESCLITQKQEDFSINYKLHLVGGDWKVYDLVIEGISLVNNYRVQFDRILSDSSYEQLIRRMKDKRMKLTGEGRAR